MNPYDPQFPETPAFPASEPVPSTAPQTPETPEAPAEPGRGIEDVMGACDHFTSREWLAVVKYLDMASHEVQGDLTQVATAVAVVEDARDSGLWRWDKYQDMTAHQLLEHLGVDVDRVEAEATKSHG